MACQLRRRGAGVDEAEHDAAARAPRADAFQCKGLVARQRKIGTHPSGRGPLRAGPADAYGDLRPLERLKPPATCTLLLYAVVIPFSVP